MAQAKAKAAETATKKDQKPQPLTPEQRAAKLRARLRDPNYDDYQKQGK